MSVSKLLCYFTRCILTCAVIDDVIISSFRYTNAQVAKYAPSVTVKFQQWLEDKNSNLSHWATRWGESSYLKNFSMITVPHLSKHPISKAKFGDYWRFWLFGVLKEGTYGLSVGDIYQALAKGAGTAYSPGLAFKHWRPGNFQFVGDFTDAELVAAYDLPINVRLFTKSATFKSLRVCFNLCLFFWWFLKNTLPSS